MTGGRIEYKYLAPNTLLQDIRADIKPYLEVDQPPARPEAREYTVRSIYYDTPRFACYDEKSDGLLARNKYRIRGYDRRQGDSVVFLEIKRKYQDFIRKHRAPLLHKDLQAFFSAGDPEKYIIRASGTRRETHDAARFLYHYVRLGLRPAVLVVYDREPLYGKFDTSLRVTFDKNLRGCIVPSLEGLYDEDRLQYALGQHFVLEVKFFRRALPAWVQSMIMRYELPRLALSKFAMCLDRPVSPHKAAEIKSGVFAPLRSFA